MFEGCNTEVSGIYRPVYSCRMRDNEPLFCPVCRGLMKVAIDPYLGTEGSTEAGSGAAQASGAASQVVGPKKATSQETNQTPPQPAYLHLVVRLTKGQNPEVLSSKIVTGKMPLRNRRLSDFGYDLRLNESTAVSEFLPEDPFLVRGFRDTAQEQGEWFERSETAVIVVKSPTTDVPQLIKENVRIRLFRLKPTAKIERWNAAAVTQMEKEKNLQVEYESPSGALGRAIERSLQKRH